jgi:hypothetical protein
MKSTVFWNITSCSLLKVNWHIRETFRLHLQNQRISWERNQPERRWQRSAGQGRAGLGRAGQGRAGQSRAEVATYLTLVSCSAYSLSLKMKVICSFEASVDFQQTTWNFIPKDRSVLCINPYFHNICVFHLYIMAYNFY